MNTMLTVRDARIIFRNFRGRVDQFNKVEGEKRNFTWVIEDQKLAEELMNDRWAVRERPSRDDDCEYEYHLKVNVSYRFAGPNVYLVTSKGITELTQETISLLDTARITKVDFAISRGGKENNDGTHSAYLDTMYVTIAEDPLADDYRRD